LEWIVRLRESGIPFAILSETYLFRRIHGGNISNAQNAMARARVRILKEHMDRRRGKPARALSGAFS
jgi:hypothetical protein